MYKNNKFLHSLYSLSPQYLKNVIAGTYSFLLAQKKYGSEFLNWSALLLESQYYNQEKLYALQQQLFSDFLKSVADNSDFYRNSAFRHGFNMSEPDIKSIKKFPVINKLIVRENYNNIQNKGLAKYKFSSSGTTGTSLNVWLDKEAYQREYAFRWLFFSVAGANRKDRIAYFLGNHLHPSGKKKPPFHLIDPYEHSIFFSLFHMSDNYLKYYLKEFNHFKPSFVKGYPSGLFVFARFIKDSGLKVYRPQALFSASEMLHAYQKELLEEVFQCPVYQWYGQVETTVNIQECEHRRLHVKEEYGFLELLNERGEDAKPGEIASVIGTGWGNKAFPLIRYNTGDNMVLSSQEYCPCGRNGRIIEKIIGRDEDFIISPDGRRIGRLDFIFKPVSNVRESQIVQESLEHIVVKVVPLAGFSIKDEEIIRQMVRKYIGNSISISIDPVESIDREINGKIRYVVSKVEQPN